MTTEDLISSAKKITPPSLPAQKEYQKHRETMVSEMNRRMANSYNLASLIGGVANTDMMKDNHNNHSRFMENLFSNYNGKIFVDSTVWAFRSYTNHGFSQSYWSAQCNNWCNVLKETMTENAYNEIYPIYNFLIIHLPELFKEATSANSPA